MKTLTWTANVITLGKALDKKIEDSSAYYSVLL